MLHIQPKMSLTHYTTKNGRCLSSIFQVKRMCVLLEVLAISFKITRVIYSSNHSGIGRRHYVHLPGQDTNVFRIFHVSVELWGSWSYLTVWSTSRPLKCHQKRLSAKLLTPKDGGSSTLASLTNRIHQVDLRILRGPCFFKACVIWNKVTNVESEPKL